MPASCLIELPGRVLLLLLQAVAAEAGLCTAFELTCYAGEGTSLSCWKDYQARIALLKGAFIRLLLGVAPG